LSYLEKSFVISRLQDVVALNAGKEKAEV
jgi:lysyl-tRNA synthetase class 1